MALGGINTGGQDIFTLKLVDDVSATSKNIFGTLENLRAGAKALGAGYLALQAHQQAAGHGTEKLNIRLKEARKIFGDVRGNLTAFRQILKLAGTSEMDAALLTSRLTKEMQKQREAALGLGDGWKRAEGAFNVIKRIATGAYEVFSKVNGVINDLARNTLTKTIENARLKQTSVNALTMNTMGDQKGARELFNWGAKASLAAGRPVGTFQGYLRELTGYGFSAENSKGLAALASDQQARLGEGYDEKLISALAAIKARGYAAFGDVGRRGRLHQAGIRADLLVPELVNSLNAQGANLGEVSGGRNAGLEEMLNKGHVSWETLVQAVVNAQQKAYGTAGSSSLTQAATLGGALDKLTNSVDYLLSFSDLDKSSGLKSLTSFVNRMVKAFTDMEGAGGRFVDSIAKSLKILFGGLDLIEESDFDKFLDGLGSVLEGMASRMREVFDLVENFLHTDMSISELAGSLLIEAGKFLGQGIWAGIKIAMGGGDRDFSKVRIGGYTVDSNEDLFQKIGKGSKGEDLWRKLESDELGQIQERVVAAGKGGWLGAFGVSNTDMANFLQDEQKNTRFSYADTGRKGVENVSGFLDELGLSNAAKVLRSATINVQVSSDHPTPDIAAEHGKTIGETIAPQAIRVLQSLLDRTGG